MNVDLILADLKIYEGWRSKPYRDPKGILTVGMGRNLESVLFSDSEIEFMGRNDIERAALVLDHFVAVWRGFTEPRQLGLIHMAFMGYTFGEFVKMITALKVGDFEEAARECLDSKWRQDVGDNRANHVAGLIENG